MTGAPMGLFWQISLKVTRAKALVAPSLAWCSPERVEQNRAKTTAE